MSRATGNLGESVAQQYLLDNNYEIIEKNFYSLYGEIDLIAHDPVADQLVFVEVKNYKKNSLLHPLEAITKKKKNRISKTAKYYLLINNLDDCNLRFDLITIENNAVKEHLKEMF